jgi:hypothetical protein
MIISDDYRFVFIHIPKCAGRTVRQQLRSYDSHPERFAGVSEHPELGAVHGDHIPLRVLHDSFPFEFRRVKDYDAFAVCRDPLDRFSSAVAHRLKMYKGVQPHLLSRRDLRRHIDEVFGYLSRHDSISDRPFIHFERQISFVELDGERIVQNVYPMARLHEMLHAISARIGKVPLAPQWIGRSRSGYRSPAVRLVVHALRPVLGGSVSAILSPAARRRLRKLVYVPFGESLSQVLRSAEVRAFVEEYYRDDIRLYSEVTGAHDALTGLQGA